MTFNLVNQLCFRFDRKLRNGNRAFQNGEHCCKTPAVKGMALTQRALCNLRKTHYLYVVSIFM